MRLPLPAIPLPTIARHHLPLAACLLSMACLASVSASEQWSDERFAPPVRPELLWVGSYGGPGDQWLESVRFHNGNVQAVSGGRGGAFGVQATFNDDGSVDKVSMGGNPNINQDVRTKWPDGGKVGSVQYGFNQVHAILQQPYLKGPGWELWGWKHAEAKATDNMADSRIRHAFLAPDQAIIAVGWTDGGNSSFRRDPRNIREGLGSRMGIGNSQTSGGGRGTSSWVFRVTPQGELTNAMVFRGAINGATWDEWGRILVYGGGVFQPRTGLFAEYGDGGGVIMASSDWKRMLFKAHVAGTKPDAGPKAAGMAWGAAIDNERGLAAICGWVDGPIQVSDSDKLRHGGGKDGFLAILRLWSPADYEAAKAKEAAAQEAAGEGQ